MYTALTRWVFIGKGSELANKYQQSEDAYRKAIDINRDDPIAWKGMLALFEASSQPVKYLDAFVGLTKALEKVPDVTAAGAAYIKANRFIRTKGDEAAKQKLLFLQLRESEIFDFLEGFLPHYEETLKKVISLLEKEETSEINKKIAKNKFRVGTDSSMMTVDEAKFKIYSESKLPRLYNELISVTHDDDLRRKTESSLLAHKYQLLLVSKDKQPLLSEIQELATGMVVIKALDSLAFKITLETQDVEDFKDLDKDVLEYYSANLTSGGLVKVIQGFLHSEISPFVVASESKTSESKIDANDAELSGEIGLLDDSNLDPSQQWTPASVLEIMAEGFDQDSSCVLSHRILAAYYIRTQEYESAADFARKGLENIKRISKETGVVFESGKNHLSAILGTAYIYYEAPKNFDSALKLFDFVLGRAPDNIASNLGKGLVLKEMGSLEKAEELLSKVVTRYPDNYQALVELSWCQILLKQHDRGRAGLLKSVEYITGHDPQSIDARAQIWWRLGQSHWACRTEGSSAEEAFNCFVNSLQENVNYAPAYTSLGFFYSEVVDDQPRAMKCFYKAFELDSGEIASAERLADDFANKSQWDLVEVIASRVVDSDRLKARAGSNKSWPYRALGIVGINKRDYALAVRNFQNALRIAQKDVNSWIGLGEAYLNSGRFTAATKAFTRAMSLDPSNWVVHYLLAISQRDASEFPQSIYSFKAILRDRPTEYGVVSSFVDTCLRSARQNISENLYGEAVDDATEAIRACHESLTEDDQLTSNIWNSISLACEILLTISSKVDLAPLEIISELLERGKRLFPEKIGKISVDTTTRKVLTSFMIHASQLSLLSSRPDKPSQAIGYYNLGLAYLKAFYYGGRQHIPFLESAITHFKTAIQLEPRHSDIWNAYGIASEPLNARVAQHSLIRSLSLNPRNASTWANLAVLYMCNGDLELASEAFEKAQSLDPEYTAAWMGQGLIEYAMGNARESESLFEHSYLISRGSEMMPKLLYGLSKFEQATRPENLKRGREIELGSGVVALQHYIRLAPNVELALLVQGMLLEREANYGMAIENILDAVSRIEQKYEESESEEDLVKFCKAKTLLSRLYLGNREFEKAVENGQTVLDILDSSGWTRDMKNDVLSALLSTGLGHYFSGSFDKSINCFRRALELSEEAQDVIILLVQVLWAQGSEQAQEVAIEQLYTSVGSKGSSMQITLILGVLGLIRDTDLLEACREELEGLSIEDLELDKEASIQEILSLIKQSIDPWQKAAFFWPSNHKIWKQLDPRIALELAKGGQAVSAEELGRVHLKADSGLESSQRAVFLAPWKVAGWAAIAGVS